MGGFMSDVVPLSVRTGRRLPWQVEDSSESRVVSAGLGLVGIFCSVDVVSRGKGSFRIYTGVDKYSTASIILYCAIMIRLSL